MVRQKVEESVPVQEIKTSAVFSVKHFSKSVVIVLLSFFCIFIGMLIYQVSQPNDDLKSVRKEQTRPVVANLKGQNTPPAFRRSEMMIKKGETPKNDNTPTIEKAPLNPVKEDVSDTLTTGPLSVNEPEPATVGDTPVLTQKEDIPANPTLLTSKVSVPTLAFEEALLLRDHLNTGKSCLSDFKKVMKAEFRSKEEKEQLVEKLMPVCTARSVFQNIEDTFYKNRKKALMTYYRLNNPLWLAYVKTILVRLVDMRKLNPNTEKPKDMISSAQNALHMKNLDMALQTVLKLPPAIQKDFRDFIGEAETYLGAQKEVENLILSFGQKGE